MNEPPHTTGWSADKVADGNTTQTASGGSCAIMDFDQHYKSVWLKVLLGRLFNVAYIELYLRNEQRMLIDFRVFICNGRPLWFCTVSFSYYSGLPFPTEYHLCSYCFLLSFFQILSTRFHEHYLTDLGYVSRLIGRYIFFTRFCCHPVPTIITLWRIIMPVQSACLRCSFMKIHIYQIIDHFLESIIQPLFLGCLTIQIRYLP